LVILFCGLFTLGLAWKKDEAVNPFPFFILSSLSFSLARGVDAESPVVRKWLSASRIKGTMFVMSQIREPSSFGFPFALLSVESRLPAGFEILYILRL